jgi:hypothetical protein
VDFGGAADGGKKSWIGNGVVENRVLLIAACFRGDGLLESRTGRHPSGSQHVLEDNVCNFRTGFSR